MDETRRCILRLPAAAAAAASSSSPLPPSSSSSPPPPPSLPWALLPPKKRLSMLLASTPTPPSPAPAAPALDVEGLAIPSSPIPRPPPLVAEAETSAPPPPIVAEAPPDDDDDDAERSTAPPPDDDDAAPKPPPPAAAVARRVRKIVKKVVVKRIVPKGTLAARKAAAAAVGAASESRGEAPTDKPEGDRNGAVGNEQTLDEESAPADCNAAGAVAVQALGFELATDSDCADARLGLREEVVDKKVEMSEGEEVVDKGVETEEVGMPEWQKRMATEVFVGGLHRDAKEENVRAAFAKAGDITEVRMIMDARTGKNKGYCFVRYREPAQAKKAIAEFGNVKICGKLCRAEAPNGNDNISLGNINTKWNKEDVKSIFVEGVPPSWDQAKLAEIFKKHGKIGSVVHSRDIQSAKRNDFAFINYITHEDAMACLKSFDKEELTEKGSKVSIKVSLSKSVQKSKQIREDHKPCISGKRKMEAAQYSIEDYPHIYSGEKRPFSTLVDDSFYPMISHYRPRHGSSTYIAATSSYGVLPHAFTKSFSPYYHDSNRYPGPASYYGLTGLPISNQAWQANSRQVEQRHRSRLGKKSKN